MTIDANDAERVAGFWAAPLGTAVDGTLDWDGQERTLDPFVWRTWADPEGTEFDLALVTG